MNASRRVGAGVLGLLLATSVEAVSFGVSPLRLDLSGNGSASVEVTNTGDAPVDLEVHAKTWSQEDGKDVHADTNDLSFYPAKFTLALKGKRVVRVTTVEKGRLPDTEKAYRLYITELPPPHHDEQGENIVVLTSFGIPLFVHQPKTRAQLTANVEGGGAGFVKVRLSNQGTGHARLTSIASEPAGIAGDKLDEWYVLPGASHLYSMPISGSLCGQPRATLRINTDQGKPLEVPVSIPGGACKSG